jgi:peptidoglycan hydrolase CwlO-like protein
VILPDLQNWIGPSGGIDALNSEWTHLDSELQKLAPQMDPLSRQLTQSNKQLEKSQADVAKLQTQGEAAKKLLQQLSE